jgi:hypothetical protein
VVALGTRKDLWARRFISTPVSDARFPCKQQIEILTILFRRNILYIVTERNLHCRSVGASFSRYEISDQVGGSTGAMIGVSKSFYDQGTPDGFF